MNPVKKLELRMREEAEHALRIAMLQADAIRAQAMATAAGIRDEAWGVAHRVGSEIRALASDEALTILEQTRAEREAMLTEQRTISAENRAATAEQTRTILAAAQNEADELIRRAELQAAAIRAAAREEEDRVRLETETGIAQLRAEAVAAAQRVHDDAERESEALSLAVAEGQELLLAVAAEAVVTPEPAAGWEPEITAWEPRPEPEVATTPDVPVAAASEVAPAPEPEPRLEAEPEIAPRPGSVGRMRRIFVALGVVLGLTIVGAGVWAVAANDDDSARSPRLAADAATTSSAAATTGATASTASTSAVAAGSAVTNAAGIFDPDAFFVAWGNQWPSLAPSNLTALQQQSLRKPVIEGAATDPDSLSDALTAGWLKGYGVFFGSSGAAPSEAATTATATVYQYDSITSTDNAFRAAQRAYVAEKPDGVTQLGAGILNARGARSFGVRYADNNEQIITGYFAYPGSLVQLSVSGAAGVSESAIQSMLATVTQWAVAAGFQTSS